MIGGYRGGTELKRSRSFSFTCQHHVKERFVHASGVPQALFEIFPNPTLAVDHPSTESQSSDEAETRPGPWSLVAMVVADTLGRICLMY